MATTRIIPMHINKGKTLGQCLSDRTDYAKNPEKTDNGQLVSSFMCDAEMVDSQFLFSKKIYEQKTGRKQKNDVIAYQVRQAFKPNEVTPELANKIGYKLAEKITKGKHAYIVATHVDREHIHNHIIWNSTTLDCTKKFRNFWNSSKAIRKISDLLCLENGLSIIENPSEKSKHYGEWLGDKVVKRPLTLSDKIRESINEVLSEKPKDFEEFLLKMETKGYEIKRGKHIAFKSNFQKKFIRLRSLGDDYSEAKIKEAINGKNTKNFKNEKLKNKNEKVNMLIDIQQKLNDGKSAGYARWAKTFNIKQMAKTINYLTEKNLLNYDDLKAVSDNITTEFAEISKSIKDAEQRMTEIAILQKYIVQFAKTKQTYNEYKKSGYNAKFKEKNIEEILLHQAAKNYFIELNLEKLPKMKELKVEYAELLTKKKKDYVKYNSVRSEMQEVLNAKKNVESMLEINNGDKEQKEKSEKNKSNDINL